MSTERDRELLFEELMSRHIDVAFHLARIWCGDPDEAEDLTQIAFIKAFRAFDRFTPGTNFKAWLLRILRNAFLDRQRAKKRRPDSYPLHLVPRDHEPQSTTPDPVAVDLENKEVFYDQFGDELARVLRQLREEHQIALLLFDVEGLSYRDIAEVLGCPLGTVRTWIHRGRVQLQKLMADHARELGYLREAL